MTQVIFMCCRQYFYLTKVLKAPLVAIIYNYLNDDHDLRKLFFKLNYILFKSFFGSLKMIFLERLGVKNGNERVRNNNLLPHGQNLYKGNLDSLSFWFKSISSPLKVFKVQRWNKIEEKSLIGTP